MVSKSIYLIGTIYLIEGIEVLKMCFIFLLNHRKYLLALNSYTSKCLFLHHIQMRCKVTAKIMLFGKFANQLCQVLSQIDPVQRIRNHVRIIFLLVIFFFIKTSIGTQKSGQFWKKKEKNYVNWNSIHHFKKGLDATTFKNCNIYWKGYFNKLVLSKKIQKAFGKK